MSENQQGNFLQPLDEAIDLMRECRDDISAICRALHMVGNSALADRLAENATDIGKAMQKTAEGRDWALRVYVRGSEEATGNMVRAALAAVVR